MNKRAKRIFQNMWNFIFADYQIYMVGILSFIFPFVLKFIFCFKLEGIEWLTWLFILVTGWVIWWQGKQIKIQLELQTLTQLFEEWDSEKMAKRRCDLCAINKSEKFSPEELDIVEGVFEFLEKIASYYRNRVLTLGLIWDTAFGWYILRYYSYYGGAISEIQKKWGSNSIPDETLYQDIKYLYKKLLKQEICQREISEEKLNESLSSTRELFIKIESDTR